MIVTHIELEQPIEIEHSSDEEELIVDRNNKADCFIAYILGILFFLTFYSSLYYIIK